MGSLGTANWNHTDMSAPIICNVSYSLDRSATDVSISLTGNATIGGDTSYPSWYGYNIYCKITLNGSEQTYQLKGNNTWQTGNGGSATKSATITVGTSSGSISGSVWFYSTNDPNGCKNGITISGNMEYSSTNSPPTAPASMSPQTGYYVNTIPLSWSASTDPDGDAINYNVIVSKNGWEPWYDIKSISDNFKGTSLSYDISGDDEGTRYYFGVRAVDSKGATSDYTHPGDISSMVVYKNKKPTTPSSISYNTYNESSISVSWGSSTDGDGHSLTYILQVSKNDNSWTTVTSTSTRSASYTISSDARGTKYKFRVIANDGYQDSNAREGSDCYRNKAPSAPGSVSVSATYFDSQVTITWTAGSDNEDSTSDLIYGIYVSKNDGADTYLYTTAKNSSSYTYDASSDSRGTKYIFKVYTIDSFDVYSSAKSSAATYRNKLPITPTISYPINNSNIYDTTPRIAIIVNEAWSNLGQTVYVQWNGVWYDSKNNTGMFSTNGNNLVKNQKIIFNPTSPVVPSSTNNYSIKIKSSDSVSTSTESETIVKVLPDNLINIVRYETKITEEIITKITTILNNVRKAYGLSIYNFSNTSANTIIRETCIDELQSSINSIRKNLNDWDINSSLDLSTNWTNVNVDSLITKSIMDEIYAAIRNM